MMYKGVGMPPVLAFIMGLVYLLFMGGMIAFSVLMMIIWWRVMKAHEKIASKLSEIADKLQLK